MKKLAALALWAVFVMVAVIAARWLFGDAARLELRGYVIAGMVLFVGFFVVFYRRAAKRQEVGEELKRREP